MKHLIILVILLCSVGVVSAQKVVRKGVTPVNVKKKSVPAFYNIYQVNGKWQEVVRATPGSPMAQSFTDTILLHIREDKAEMRDGVSMNMKGNASIEKPNLLHVAGDTYTIRSLSGNTMILDDGTYTHRMQRIPKFHYESLGKDSLKLERFENPVVVNAKDLEGKWLVYRRHAQPGSTEDENLIKSVHIKGVSADSINGEVVIYNADVTLPLTAKFVFENGRVKMITDRKTWEFNTYKADGKEFVFGNEQLMYYAKPL